MKTLSETNKINSNNTIAVDFSEFGFPDGLLLFQDRKLVKSNPTANELLGLSAEHTKSPLFLNQIIAQSDIFLVEAFIDSSANEKYSNLQVNLKTSGGELLWAEAWIKREIIAEFEVIQIIFHNISAFKNVQEKMTLIYHAIQQSADTFVITDSEGTIEFVNSAFSNATGYRQDEVLGKNPRIMKSSRTAPEIFVDMWRTIKLGKVWKGEVINRRKDGSLIEVELVISPFFNEEGKIIKFIGCHRDISEKKQMIKELIFLEKLSIAGELAPKIAHEMNNQLMVINGKAEKAMFLLSNKNTEIEKALNDTLDEIENMARQIRNLMNIGKPQKYEITRFNLVEVFLYSVQAMETTGILKHIKINWHNDKTEHIISGDFHSLVQVINNLLINASHAMKGKGEISIGVRKRNSSISGFVSDNGSGIPDEVKSKIFDPFFTTKEPGKGTGLGLAVSKQIINSHQGNLWFHSRSGKGTIFFIDFPLSPAES